MSIDSSWYLSLLFMVFIKNSLVGNLFEIIIKSKSLLIQVIYNSKKHGQYAPQAPFGRR